MDFRSIDQDRGRPAWRLARLAAAAILLMVALIAFESSAVAAEPGSASTPSCSVDLPAADADPVGAADGHPDFAAEAFIASPRTGFLHGASVLPPTIAAILSTELTVAPLSPPPRPAAI